MNDMCDPDARLVAAKATFDRIMAETAQSPGPEPSEEDVRAWGEAFELAACRALPSEVDTGMLGERAVQVAIPWPALWSVAWDGLSDKARSMWRRVGATLYADGRASRDEEVERLTRERDDARAKLKVAQWSAG